MTHAPNRVPRRFGYVASTAILTILGLALCGAPALAGETEAKAAISAAGAKIDMVTSHAGQAGQDGDQSFNMARQRLIDANVALKDGQYDTAERLADEGGLLATLTSEKAALAALQVSHENLIASAGAGAVTQ